MNNVCDIKFVGRGIKKPRATRNAFHFRVAFDGELPYPWGGPSLNTPVIDEEGYHTLMAERYYGEWIFLLHCN